MVDEQLRLFRHERGPNTLQWVAELEEFHNWRMAPLDESSSGRILWLRGTSGIGKSTIAAYVVDLLMRRSPNSIVAYFFCRSNQEGLTRADDILRSLACQCYRSDLGFRGVLRALNGEGGMLESEHDISSLFQKLLGEPLLASQKETCIILDGLDEIDPSDRSAVDILLNLLVALRSTRVLFLSNWTSNIGGVIPNLTIKSISLQETGKDIDAYVNRVVNESGKLTVFFGTANVNPIQYFRQHGNGVFLWVGLVLRILANCKNPLIFQQRLTKFCDVPESVEALYVSALSGIDKEYQPWAQEVIRWVVLAETRFRLSDLQKAVEWSMQRPLADFRGFLEFQCGIFLEFAPTQKALDPLVQVIHETFRSFVLYSQKCPPEFRINPEASHGQLALHCMRALATAGRPISSNYGLLEWASHLSKARVFDRSAELFADIGKFFNSEGGKLWIRRCIISNVSVHVLSASPHEIEVEIPHLQPIIAWMSFWQASREDGGMGIVGDGGSAKWRSDTLMETSTIIHEYFGKAAITLWLGGDLTCFEAQACFLLALKYYWRRNPRSGSNLSDIEELVATEFKSMSEWANYEGATKRTNLGMGYYVSQRWEDCIRCLSAEDNNSIDVLRHLGLAYMANRDYDNAIKTFEQIVHAQPRSSLWLRPGLLDAYLAKGDCSAAINKFQTAITQNSNNPFPRAVLGYCYIASGDYEAAVKIFNNVPNGEWPLLGLYTVYMSNRDYKTGIERLKAYQGATWKHQCLAELYYIAGDYDAAIELFSPPTSSMELPHFVSGRLLTYMEKQDWGATIVEFETAVEKKVRLSTVEAMSAALEAYKRKGAAARAVDMFKRGIANFSRNDRIRRYWLWGLLEAYKAEGEFGLAIQALKASEEFASSAFPPATLLISALKAYERIGDFREASDVLEIAARKMTFIYGSLLSQCVLDFCKATKQYGYAIQLFEDAVKTHPLCPWLWSRLGESYNANRDYESAVDVYRTAISHVSVNYVFHKHLGDIYLRNSHPEDAIDEYNTTIHLSQRKAILWAYLRMELGLPPEFQSTTAITIDDSLVHRHFLWYSLGEAYKAINDTENANKVYDTVIEAYRLALTNGTRNDLFWQFNEPDIEWGLFDVFYRKSSLPASVLWTAMATAYLCKGDIIESARAYHNALEQDESNQWLRNVVLELEEASGLLEGGPDSVLNTEHLVSQPPRTERSILVMREIGNRKAGSPMCPG